MLARAPAGAGAAAIAVNAPLHRASTGQHRRKKSRNAKRFKPRAEAAGTTVPVSHAAAPAQRPKGHGLATCVRAGPACAHAPHWRGAAPKQGASVRTTPAKQAAAHTRQPACGLAKNQRECGGPRAGRGGAVRAAMRAATWGFSRYAKGWCSSASGCVAGGGRMGGTAQRTVQREAADAFGPIAVGGDQLHAAAGGADQLQATLHARQRRGHRGRQRQRKPHQHPADKVVGVAQGVHGARLWTWGMAKGNRAPAGGVLHNRRT